MKVLSTIVLVLLALQINANTVSEKYLEYEQEFKNFMQEYEKEYPNFYMYEQALKNYVGNLELVKKLNEEEGEELYGITQYFDKHYLDIQSNLLMPPQDAHELPQEKMAPLRSYPRKVPDFWDWRQHNAVTPVYDQGWGGTCWTFSTVGTIEGAWSLAGNNLTQLSKEQLVECDATRDSAVDRADCGVFGGWPYLGLTYVHEVGGIASEQDYRYCVGVPMKQDPCLPCTADNYDEKICGPGIYPPQCKPEKWHCRDQTVPFTAHIDGWLWINSNEETIKNELYHRGPISVLMNAGWLYFKKKGKIYNPKKCNPETLSHAVLLVGYGTDQESGQDYWIVKNSWGPKWDDHGFFKLARGSGKCGINKQPVVAIVNKLNQEQEQIEI